MGRAKEWMMLLESYDWKTTHVEFTCPACKKFSDGQAEVPVIYPERGLEDVLPVELRCIYCGERHDAEIRDNELGVPIIEMTDEPDVKVEFEPLYDTSHDEQDYWEPGIDYDPPSEPFDIFRQAFDEIQSLLVRNPEASGTDPMHRMIFMQCFSAFEAYLCDTYLNLVFYNEETKKILVSKHKELKKLSVETIELLNHSNLTVAEYLQKIIKQHIHSTMFHNFEKVRQLYGMFGVTFLDDDGASKQLAAARDLRHHCVHRNGRDKDGNELTEITYEYVNDVSRVMMVTASNLDDAINSFKVDLIGI